MTKRLLSASVALPDGSAARIYPNLRPVLLLLTWQIAPHCPAGQGLSGPVTRASNQVMYFTPNLGGLYRLLSHWFGNNPHNGAVNQDDGTGNGARVGYQTKVWEVAAAWSKTTYRNTPVATTAGAPSGDLATWNVAGSYDIGLAKLMATYAHDERETVVPTRARGWLLAAVVPVGPDEFRASVGEYRIDAGMAVVPHTLQWGIGYVHNLSKRTALYTTFARASNHDGARVAVGGASVGAGVLNLVFYLRAWSSIARRVRPPAPEVEPRRRGGGVRRVPCAWKEPTSFQT